MAKYAAYLCTSSKRIMYMILEDDGVLEVGSSFPPYDKLISRESYDRSKNKAEFEAFCKNSSGKFVVANQFLAKLKEG